MSQSFARSTPANSFRGWLARLWDDPDSRSTLVGVVGVILIYLLLWLMSPLLRRLEPLPTARRPHAAAKQFSIQLAPNTFKKPAPKPEPLRFVETNPDAPENKPDKTNNFAAQNQQVAQEKPTAESRSERPAMEGKKDSDSMQIVTGQLTKPVEHMEAVPELVTPPQPATAEQVVAEQNPLPGFEKKLSEDKAGYGSNVAIKLDNARPIPRKIEGAKDVPLNENATATQPAIDPRRPQPRPQLVRTQQTRPAILADNKFGTSNMGLTAINANWSNYGAYLQRLVNVVDTRWNDILQETKTYPPSGSEVVVTFILNSEGRVTRIVNVESTASEAGKLACVSGITDRAPYGVWTDDMKALLGEEQQMTFRFYYQ